MRDLPCVTLLLTDFEDESNLKLIYGWSQAWGVLRYKVIGISANLAFSMYKLKWTVDSFQEKLQPLQNFHFHFSAQISLVASGLIDHYR